MQNPEVLRAENNLLRDQVQQLRDQVQQLQTQLTHTQGLLDDERTERAKDLARHHSERMALINAIGNKVDELLTSHNNTKTTIIERLDGLEGKLTVPPTPPKTHGYAITSRPLAGDLQELRFIAGQAKYVERRITEVEDDEDVIVPFTMDGNPIDLRNNFQKAATRSIRDNIGRQEAIARGIEVKCCKSKITEDLIDDVLDHVLDGCTATAPANQDSALFHIRAVRDEYPNKHAQVIAFLATLRDRAP
ncbi:hypothetical protein ON010_g11152 [Phytophthora cinnamomi]|nr:hypothetical protein ON010_g11152 [Phytophthora cinnamomi]